MQKLHRAGRILCVVSSLCIAAIAQPPAESQPRQAASTSRTLTFDVVVTDKSGAAVPNLQPGDFVVNDNRQPTKILSFAAHLPPPSADQVDATSEIFLIFDEVNASFAKGAYEREEVQRFLRQNQGALTHPVSLGFFTDSGLQIQTQPSADGNALATAIEQRVHSFRNIGPGQGFQGDEIRLRLSLDALLSLATQEQGRPGKKMVIWISPGWPLLSGPRTTISSSQQQHVFDSVVHLSALLHQARITLYSIDPLGATDAGSVRSTFYETFVKGLTTPAKADFGDLALQVFATHTGGRVIVGNDMIANSLNHCVGDLKAYYSVSIQIPPAEQPNEYHSLEVKVARPGLAARSLTGYYAQP